MYVINKSFQHYNFIFSEPCHTNRIKKKMFALKNYVGTHFTEWDLYDWLDSRSELLALQKKCEWKRSCSLIKIDRVVQKLDLWWQYQFHPSFFNQTFCTCVHMYECIYVYKFEWKCIGRYVYYVKWKKKRKKKLKSKLKKSY